MTDSTWKLGRYVRVVTNKDLTHGVAMIVPDGQRPIGWPKSIRLPEYWAGKGSLYNPKYLKAVEADAARLNSQLNEERRLDLRRAQIGKLDRRGIPELVDIYLNSDEYKFDANGWGQYRNRRILTILLEWSAARGHPEFETITKSHITSQLRAFDDRPHERLSLRAMWNKLARFAQEEFGRLDNPCEGLRWERTKPAAIHIWFPETVEKYAEAANAMGQPGLAAFLRVQYWLGQRTSDAREARYDLNYIAGQVNVRQGKTDEMVPVPLPVHLRDEIERVRLEGSDYLFNDYRTGTAFTEKGIGLAIACIRNAILKVGDPVHDARTLRHSAVCEMARLGLTDLEISSRTGHKLLSLASILPRYMVDREGVARAAAIKQHMAAGGSKEDFLPENVRAHIKDWEGDASKLKYHHLRKNRPAIAGQKRKSILGGARRSTWTQARLTAAQVSAWTNASM